MNLKDSRTRRVLLAFGATAAVVAGGLTVGITAASAVGTLTLSPSTTTITTADWGNKFGAGTADWTSPMQSLNDVAYGVSVATENTALVLVLESSPSLSAGFFYGQVLTSAHTGPVVDATNGEWNKLTTTTPGTTNTSGVAPADALTLNDDTYTKSTYFAADTPGEYKVHFVDTAAGDPNAPLATSPTITINVLDVEAVTGTTADDWAPVVSAPSTLGNRAPMSAGVPFTAFTTTDSRGSVYLSTYLAVITGLVINGGGNAETNPTVMAQDGTGTSGYRALAAGLLTTAGTVTSTAYMDVDGDTTWTIGAGEAVAFGTAGATTVAADDATVSGVTNDSTDVVGSAYENTAGAVAVKPGTSTVTFTSTTTDSDATKSNVPVYFTLTSSTGSPTLTATGTRIGRISSTAVVYTANTNTSGLASITVTSSSTVVGTVYTVNSYSNADAGSLYTATYAATVAKTLDFTNTAASLIVPVGGTATLSGTVKDNFGSLFTPGTSDTALVTLTMSTGSPSPVYAPISAGTWTTTWTKSTAGTAGSTFDAVASYDQDGAGAIATATPDTATVTWASTGTVSTLAFTAPTAAFTRAANLWDATPVATHLVVTGTATDSTGAVLAGKAVTVTGTTGVYLTDGTAPSATNHLATSVTVPTNTAGVYTVWAWFTKSGAATLTATSGSASTTVSGTIAAATVDDGYRVTITGSTGIPGATQNITGQVVDAFGNGAVAQVDLSLGTSTIGTLATNPVTANSAGMFSTTFTPASATASGTATLTATIKAGGAVLTANPLANSVWNTVGVTLADGVYQTTGAIEIAAPVVETVVLAAPTSRTGAGSVTLTGTTTANEVVKLYGKNLSGGTFGFLGTATANSSGVFTKAVTISVSTVFVASINSDGAYSNEVTTRVLAAPVVLHSTVSLRATALGSGRVRLLANGGQHWGTTKLYQRVGSRWVLKGTYRANVNGDVSVVLRATRGVKTFRAVYTAPGRYAAGANASVRVR